MRPEKIKSSSYMAVTSKFAEPPKLEVNGLSETVNCYIDVKVNDRLIATT